MSLKSTQVAIIKTGTANLASVVAALRRLGIDEPDVVESPHQVKTDARVILPGVGSFGAGMSQLDRTGWREPLLTRYANNLPTLGICLGFQILATASDESPGVQGLGILPAVVRRLPANVKSPQFGWNRVATDDADSPGQFAYYANSYCVGDLTALRNAGWNLMTTNYGVRFVAAARRGNWLGCQFHPELSGEFGLQLLADWLSSTRIPRSAPSC